MNIPTPAIIAVSALLSLAITGLALWVRRLRKDYDAVSERHDNIYAAFTQVLEGSAKIIREKNDRLNEGCRIHTEQLKIEARLRAQVQIMQEILVRVSPGARLIIHDPTKLSAWLERLKAGKRKAKPKWRGPIVNK